MSLSQVSNRNSVALTLLQQVGPSRAPKTDAGGTSDIVKIANGMSAAPGAAAKQAAAAAFAVDPSLKTDAREGGISGVIAIAGIGGGDNVERFASWEAVNARINNDGTLSSGQKSEWLAKISDFKKMSSEARAIQEKYLDFYENLRSGTIEIFDGSEQSTAFDPSKMDKQALVKSYNRPIEHQ